MANDLVIKILGDDSTSPAIRSATAGVISYGQAVRTTMQKVSNETARARNSWMSFVDLTTKRGGDHWDGLWKNLNDPEGIQGMERRQRAMDHTASMYEKSTNRMARALQKLNQDEAESAAQSLMILNRTVSQEEALMSRRGRGGMPQRGGVTGQRQMMVQQGVFMIDDAIAGGTNGGVRGALLGASNNATMLAMMLGGVGTQLTVIGGIAAFQIGLRMYESFQKAKDGAKQVQEEIGRIQDATNRISTNPVKFRYLDEEIAGQSSQKLGRMKQEADATVLRMRGSIDRLQAQEAQAQALVRRIDTPGAMRFDNQQQRQEARRDALRQSEAIRERITVARNEWRAAQELLVFMGKTNAIDLARKREDADAAQKKLEAEQKAIEAEKKRVEFRLRHEEQLERFHVRLQNAQAKHQQKRQNFARDLFGDAGVEQGILAGMHEQLQQARQLFAGPQLAAMENQIRGIAEEQLARQLLRQRTSGMTNSPALAMVDSDRARQITLGAGNQMRDASTKEDKHRAAVEQLAADQLAGIRELVRQGEQEINVVVEMR